jgi:hypothetical protein
MAREESEVMDPVTCPSCGSQYNPETRELVQDTGLQARIRELEAGAETLRENSAALQTKLDDAEVRLAMFSVRRPKERDFFVGERA